MATRPTIDADEIMRRVRAEAAERLQADGEAPPIDTLWDQMKADGRAVRAYLRWARVHWRKVVLGVSYGATIALLWLWATTTSLASYYG